MSQQVLKVSLKCRSQGWGLEWFQQGDSNRVPRGLQWVPMGSNGFQWVPRGSKGLQGVTRGYKGYKGLKGFKRGVKGVISKGFQRLLPWYKRVQRGNLKGVPRVSERVPNGSKGGSKGKSQGKNSNWGSFFSI